MNICLSSPNILWEICRFLTPRDIRVIASTNTILKTSGHEVAMRLNTLCYNCGIIRNTKPVLGMREPAWWCADCSEDNAWQCMACYCYDTRIFTALSIYNYKSAIISDENTVFVHRAGECVFDNCRVCDGAITFRMDAWILKSRHHDYYNRAKSIGCETSDIICADCVRGITKPDNDSTVTGDLMGDYCLAGSWVSPDLTEPSKDKLGWAESFLEFEYKREINIDYAGMLNVDQYSPSVRSNISSHNLYEPKLQYRNSSLVCKRCRVAFDNYRDVRYVSAPVIEGIEIKWLQSYVLNSDYQESTFVLSELNVNYAPQILKNTFGLYCVDCLRVVMDAGMYMDACANTHMDSPMQCREFMWNDDSDIYNTIDGAIYTTPNILLNNLTQSLDSAIDSIDNIDNRRDNHSGLIYTRIHRIKHWPKYNIECVYSDCDYSSDMIHISELDGRMRSNSM